VVKKQKFEVRNDTRVTTITSTYDALDHLA